ncbi:aminodeoxychorismate lyase [Ectothiorhodospiraceae bacterium 2226]|nr:aminodeoxychorismate lyase [Ectothiorhodospiraceae bacterium 2226]
MADEAGPAIWVDGEPAAALLATDRGLHYGDGLFETLAVHDGRIRHLARHLARLSHGASCLDLPPPDRDTLRAELTQAAEGYERAVLKLLYTAGSGGRGYCRPAQPVARRILLRYPWPAAASAAAQAEGVRVRLCQTRLAGQPRLAGLKHLNRLEYVLASRELAAEGGEPAAEGLLLDGEGTLVEGTRSNLFLVRGGGLLTPRLERCGVAGIARAVLMECAAALGLPCEERRLDLDDLAQAEEVFVCNSIIGIWPVRAWDDHRYLVGPVTRRLQAAWEGA